MSSSDGTTARIDASGRPSAATAARMPDRTAAGSLPGDTVSVHGSPGRGPSSSDETPGTAAEHGPGVAVVGALGQVQPDLDLAPPIAEPRGQLVHGPLPDQPSRGEDADPVAHALDLVQQVAREQDGHPALADEPAQQVEDLRDAERVDRRRRLVEDQDVGILHERIGDAEPLEHAARVRVGPVVGSVGQADLVEDLVDRRLPLRSRGSRLSRAV